MTPNVKLIPAAIVLFAINVIILVVCAINALIVYQLAKVEPDTGNIVLQDNNTAPVLNPGTKALIINNGPPFENNMTVTLPSLNAAWDAGVHAVEACLATKLTFGGKLSKCVETKRKEFQTNGGNK